MKTILTFIAIAIVGLSTFSGCQKFDYGARMNAKIDTLTFSASGQQQVIAHVDTTTHNPQLVIISGNTTIYTPGTSFQPSIVLTVPNVIGTYVIDTSDRTRSAMVYTASTGSAGTVAVSGQIVILNISGGKIQGNFSLTCKDGTTVTNGTYIGIESFY